MTDALYWNDRGDASKVTDEVDGGIVTLTGTVPTYRSWTTAGEDAQVERDPDRTAELSRRLPGLRSATSA